MPSTVSTFLSLANLATLISAHGFITSPSPRLAGPAMASACGQQMYNNQAADNYGNIQGELQVANGQSDYNAAACNVWTCKGFKYEDNTDKVQTYSVGQTVNMLFDIRAPHTGTANVSIVTSDGAMVSTQPLVSWDVFASNSVPLSEQTDETSFSIMIPDIGDACTTPGKCVIQHFWDARSIDQTYESCVDVVIGGSGSGNSSSSSAPASPSSSSSSSLAAASSIPSSSSVLASATSTPLSTGTGIGAASPSISAPSLPINATSTKKPCSKKPRPTGASGSPGPVGTGSGAAAPSLSIPVPSGSGVAGIPTTLSTIAVPSFSAPAAPSATGTGTGAGEGAGSGSESTSTSSISELIKMIMSLIEGIVGSPGGGES